MQSFFILIFSFIVILISGFLTESSAEPTWQIKPALTISETYNSNIYSNTYETEDFITGTGANINASYTGSSVKFQTSYLATLNTYAHHPELNVLTHDGNISVDVTRWLRKFSREVNITVTEDFTYTPELIDYYFDAGRGDTGSLSNYGIRTGLNDSFRNAGSIGIRLPLTHNQDMNLRYSNFLTEFSNPGLVDNIVHTLSIGTSYATRSNTFYGDIGIRNSTADSIYLHNYFITSGLRHSFSPVSQGEISVGGEIIDHETLGHSSNIRGALKFSRTSEFLSYHIGYSRELNSVSGVSAAPVVTQTIYINIAGRHTRQLSSNIGANYTKNNSLDGNDVDIKSYNISAGAVYVVRSWLTGSLSASHFRQDSEVSSAQDIERNLIMFQISASWGA